jgi:hypothetical protein
VAFVHSLTAGNDLGIWWVLVIEWGSAAAVATAVLARLIAAVRHSAPAGQPSAGYERITPRERAHR